VLVYCPIDRGNLFGVLSGSLPLFAKYQVVLDLFGGSEWTIRNPIERHKLVVRFANRSLHDIALSLSLLLYLLNVEILPYNFQD